MNKWKCTIVPSSSNWQENQSLYGISPFVSSDWSSLRHGVLLYMMIRSPLFQISIETGWITPLQILQVYCAVYWWHPGESGGPTYQLYPPFFYYVLRNFVVLSRPRKSAMGSRSPGPKMSLAALLAMGQTTTSNEPKPGRRGFLTTSYTEKSAGDWGTTICLMYCIRSILLAQYTYEFLFL